MLIIQLMKVSNMRIMKISHLYPLPLQYLETLLKPPTSTQPTNHNIITNNIGKNRLQLQHPLMHHLFTFPFKKTSFRH